MRQSYFMSVSLAAFSAAASASTATLSDMTQASLQSMNGGLMNDTVAASTVFTDEDRTWNFFETVARKVKSLFDSNFDKSIEGTFAAKEIDTAKLFQDPTKLTSWLNIVNDKYQVGKFFMKQMGYVEVLKQINAAKQFSHSEKVAESVEDALVDILKLSPFKVVYSELKPSFPDPTDLDTLLLESPLETLIKLAKAKKNANGVSAEQDLFVLLREDLGEKVISDIIATYPNIGSPTRQSKIATFLVNNQTEVTKAKTLTKKANPEYLDDVRKQQYSTSVTSNNQASLPSTINRPQRPYTNPVTRDDVESDLPSHHMPPYSDVKTPQILSSDVLNPQIRSNPKLPQESHSYTPPSEGKDQLNQESHSYTPPSEEKDQPILSSESVTSPATLKVSSTPSDAPLSNSRFARFRRWLSNFIAKLLRVLWPFHKKNPSN
ncbi:hypothetical protein Plhal703r1_c38g0135081 [Plasmopara halstedii]